PDLPSIPTRRSSDLPSEWRAAHASDQTFLATPHPDGYVSILPPDEVEKLRAKFSAMKFGDSEAQAFAARFSSQTQGFSFDKSGRSEEHTSELQSPDH